MHINMPPSDTERNIESVKRAVERKRAEMLKARDHYNNLQAELRGLEEALGVLASYNRKLDANPATSGNL
jgi:hypothetical protein